MNYIKKLTALTLVLLIITTNTVAVFADTNDYNKEIMGFTNSKYINMDLGTLDSLLKQNIDNDVIFIDLLRAKAVKENKIVDEDYYKSLCNKANNSKEDFDKLVKYLEDISIFVNTRQLTTEEFKSLQSTYSLNSVGISDFVIEQSIGYGARYTNDEEEGLFYNIMGDTVEVGFGFIHEVAGIVWTLLGYFDASDVRYSRKTNQSSLNDISYVGNLVRCTLDGVVYAIVNEENEYCTVRTVQWNGAIKSDDKTKNLGIVRFGYNSNYNSTTGKKQLGLDMYNVQGFKLVPINKNSYYDKTYLFNY